jgi:hypothetical protein
LERDGNVSLRLRRCSIRLAIADDEVGASGIRVGEAGDIPQRLAIQFLVGRPVNVEYNVFRISGQKPPAYKTPAVRSWRRDESTREIFHLPLSARGNHRHQREQNDG